ncbi:MAG TPA: hypothetical protein VEC95_00725 [Terriglobales bacterium]|nr:hypothetical protein [Terriglobales bacterium]
MIVGKHTAQLILLALVILVAGGYLLAWRSKRSLLRKSGSWIVAGVAALAGYLGTTAYAIPGLDDFHNPVVPFATALIGNAVVWATCLGAWGIAVRLVIFALRKVPANQP